MAVFCCEMFGLNSKACDSHWKSIQAAIIRHMQSTEYLFLTCVYDAQARKVFEQVTMKHMQAVHRTLVL